MALEGSELYGDTIASELYGDTIASMADSDAVDSLNRTEPIVRQEQNRVVPRNLKPGVFD